MILFDILGVILFLPTIFLLLAFFFPHDILFKSLSIGYCLFIWGPKYFWNVWRFKKELKANVVWLNHPESGIKLGHFHKVINYNNPGKIKDEIIRWQNQKGCFFIESHSLKEELLALRVNVFICFGVYVIARLAIF